MSLAKPTSPADTRRASGLVADIVGFIGIGRMGSALARRYLAAGGSVIAYDTDPYALAVLADSGAQTTSEIDEIFATASVIVVCLPSAEASVHVADLAANGGAVCDCYIETSTIGQSACIDIAQRLQHARIAFVDAPVSGGPRGVAAHGATSMVAGKPAAVAKAKTVLDGYSNQVIEVGAAPGLGQICKLVNNAISLSTLAIACEATAAGVRAGLDLGKAIEAINASSGFCASTRDKFPQSIVTGTFNYGASMQVAVKDLQLFLEDTMAYRQSGLKCIPALAELWQRATISGDPQRDFTELYLYFEGSHHRDGSFADRDV